MKKSDYLYSFLWLVILFVSSVDIYWSIKVQDQLLKNELNPIGRSLIIMDDGDVALFMAVKSFGTMLALAFLILLHIYYRRLSFVVCGGLFIFMVGLFVVLVR